MGNELLTTSGLNLLPMNYGPVDYCLDEYPHVSLI